MCNVKLNSSVRVVKPPDLLVINVRFFSFAISKSSVR